MTNSFKKAPFGSFACAKSDKKDKVRASRATRRVNARALKTCVDLVEFQPLSNVQINGEGGYLFAKDGKCYLGYKTIVRK